jgi:hypothetical protein
MDNLEKFITNNKDEFEEDFDNNLSANLWSKINQDLDKTVKVAPKTVRMVPIQRIWQIAAGFAALLVVGLSMQFYYLQQRTLSESSVEKLVPELAEAEKFYSSQISQTKTVLSSYNLKEVGIESDLKEIDNLDKAYNELKTEFYKSGDKEAIISAMIQNLQLRAELLNQKLQVIQRAEKVKKGQVEI